MGNRLASIFVILGLPLAIAAQKPPLLPENQVSALAQELSGETAKRNLEGIARNHRQRGSRGFHGAAELVAERARAYGLSGVEILQFPADGKAFYGTQRSRQPWDADFAELWVMHKDGDAWTPSLLVASYEAMPITLAEDSESADVTADLIDIGDGASEGDYAGKDVRGKIVLTSAQPGAVEALAVDKFGAAGIISCAQNQRTAWWGEDENMIRWGHLQSFPKTKTFAFMVSLKTARSLRERLAHGEQIHLHAVVRAGQHPGSYEVVTAVIPGVDPKLKDQEIAFSCHLDHQRPGANDNASGCATILEVARTLQKLISEGKLARPARTIRFIWPPEIEGTTTLLNAKPEFAHSIKAVIHMDMVGGGPETKAIFHVTRGPLSLPSFVYDVAEAFAEFANEQTERFADTGVADYPLTAPEGGKEPLRAEFAPFSMGSDHDVYQDGSFRIPAVYFNDWPDRYIHTNLDTAANIDPTKLKRAAFIGAASGYFLATLTKDEEQVSHQMLISVVRRHAANLVRSQNLSPAEVSNLIRFESSYSRQSFDSYLSFLDSAAGEQVAAASGKDSKGPRPVAHAPVSQETRFTGHSLLFFDLPAEQGKEPLPAFLVPLTPILPETLATGDGLLVFTRNLQPKGPLTVFGYDYFEDHAKAAGIATPRLLSYQGLWGAGAEYAYETLNFIDGKRNAQQIRDAVSAEYGPAPLDMIVEYLKALEKIGVVSQRH